MEAMPEVMEEPVSNVDSIMGTGSQILTPEGITALLASVDPEPEPEPEPVPSPLIEDGNRMMSPEDIAALIGNTAVDGLPETISPIEAEERPLMPDLSNPSN